MEGDVQERFDRLMDELRAAGLAEAYLVILAVARSVQHLETLHGRLDPNQRLLREDFIVLREFWKGLWQGRKAVGGKLPKSSVGVLLKAARIEGCNLGLYYGKRLDSGRPAIDTHSHDHYPREVVVSGNPASELGVLQPGLWFQAHCTFFGSELMVELSVPAALLTEEKTYHLRNTPGLARAALNQSRRARSDGHEVNWILVFEDMGDLKRLAMVSTDRNLITTVEFERAIGKLIATEFGISGLFPVPRTAIDNLLALSVCRTVRGSSATIDQGFASLVV